MARTNKDMDWLEQPENTASAQEAPAEAPVEAAAAVAQAEPVEEAPRKVELSPERLSAKRAMQRTELISEGNISDAVEDVRRMKEELRARANALLDEQMRRRELHAKQIEWALANKQPVPPMDSLFKHGGNDTTIPLSAVDGKSLLEPGYYYRYAMTKDDQGVESDEEVRYLRRNGFEPVNDRDGEPFANSHGALMRAKMSDAALWRAREQDQLVLRRKDAARGAVSGLSARLSVEKDGQATVTRSTPLSALDDLVGAQGG